MNLQFLLQGLDVVVPALNISDISSASRSIRPGGLFLACAGVRHHGLEFIDQALAAGAGAVAWEPVQGVGTPVLPEGLPGIAIPGLTSELGGIANRFFGAPSESLEVTGITGTNGKTTTAFLVARALDRLGKTTGYMGTLGYGFGEELQASSMTTPDCITVHRRLRALLDAGATHVVTEVSSHALDQQRVSGVRIRTGAFTNLSRDHLDYHGDLDRYGAAKARLFRRAGMNAAVVNVTDDFGKTIAAEISAGANAAMELVTVGRTSALDSTDRIGLQYEISQSDPHGLQISLSGDYGKATISSPLWGAFNAENLAMAAGILLAHGYSLSDATAALVHCSAPPGRMQTIAAGSGQPTVLVDFAHTPDGLSKLLTSVRSHCNGTLWLVFGCGGDRDAGKRSVMGSVAVSLADRVVVTSDNPRSENPDAIIRQIVAGTDDSPTVEIIADRAAAITSVINSAASDDVVVIAGKGHETKQIFSERSVAFSDAAVANAALTQIAGMARGPES